MVARRCTASAPAAIFGERVLLGEGLRTGTVRALEDSVVLMVGAEDFSRLTAALPPLQGYFDRYVSDAFEPAAVEAEWRRRRLRAATARRFA
jgi:CRP-like cAMP-binding protein